MITMLLRVLGTEHARPVRRAMALMATASVAEGLAYALLVPVLAALFGPAPADAWPWLILFSAAMLGVASLRYIADLSGLRAGSSLLRGMYRRLGDQLARLPVGWFVPGRVGEVSALAGTGVLQVMSVIAHLLAPLIAATVTPATIIAVTLAMEWRMGLAASIAAVVVVVVRWWTGRLMDRADSLRVRREQEATARVIEHVQAQPILRMAPHGPQRLGQLESSLRELRRASRHTTRSALPGMIGVGLTVQAALTGFLALGAHFALAGELGAAELLALLVLSARCADPLLALSDLGAQMHAARTQLTALESVLREQPLPEPRSPIRPQHHGLAFDAVTFRRGEHVVLDDVSLTVAPGERLALVGPSGAGKSTLLHLISRFHDVDHGAVKIGGVDVRSLGTRSVSNMVSIVFQSVHLFTGSILDNVRLGQPDASEEQVRAAAAAAGLDELIERLPDGWSTEVGEGGALLSGGERQRVSIARALLKDAPIVLLDEVTAALDPRTAAGVHEGIERLCRGRTVVMVAHQLRTVASADRIAFLDAHQILEQGTHEDLLRARGRYAQFWVASTAVPGSIGPTT